MTAAQVRQLAGHLIEAADELDRLNDGTENTPQPV